MEEKTVWVYYNNKEWHLNVFKRSNFLENKHNSISLLVSVIEEVSRCMGRGCVGFGSRECLHTFRLSRLLFI